jgi:predicted lipid-binding transport protein (Tim44 family)
MIKKILLGSVLVGLVGLLVFGAVNRTIAKSGEELSRFEDSQRAGESAYGQGQGTRSGGDSAAGPSTGRV